MPQGFRPQQQQPRRFQYQQRDEGALKKQAERAGGDFDNVLNDTYPVFKTSEGQRCIRIMPPTWFTDGTGNVVEPPVRIDETGEMRRYFNAAGNEIYGAPHFAYKIWWHRNVGVDGGTYLCPKKMLDQPCCICDERQRAQREGGDGEDYVKSLKPIERAVFILIDRDKESEGPLIWACPWMTEREIAGLCVAKRGRPTRWIDNPEEGYDLDFTIQGTKAATRFLSMALAPQPTPLCNDEGQQEAWLNYLAEHPIPDCLIWHDQERIAAALAGGPPPADRGAADNAPARPARRRRQCAPANARRTRRPTTARRRA